MLHTVCDGDGRPIILLLSEGQMSDHKGARLVLGALPPASHLIADLGYDSAWFREELEATAIAPCIPSSRSRKVPFVYDTALYRHRSRSRTCSPNSRTGGAFALFDSAVALLANVASGHPATGNVPKRYGNAHATVVPYQLMNTQNGVIALAVGNDSQFRTLCSRVLGRPEVSEDVRFATNRNRSINRDVLIPLLASLFQAKPNVYWLAELKRFGIPAGAVRTVSEALSSPEVEERQMVVTVPDRLHGELKLMNSPLKFSATPTRFPQSPPRLGEHTRDVLERLGV